MSNKGLKDVYETQNKGMYFAQKFCPICKKLLTGKSTTPENGARSDLGAKFNQHKEKCGK